MSDLKNLLKAATSAPWIRPWGATHVHAWGRDDVLDSQPNLDLIVHLRNHAEDYEAAVDALDSLLELIRTESISFEDESMRRSLSKIADARTVLRRLRDEVPA